MIFHLLYCAIDLINGIREKKVTVAMGMKKKHDIGQETESAFVMFCHLFGKQLRQYCSKTSLHLKLPKIMQVSILNKRSDKQTKSETG